MARYTTAMPPMPSTLSSRYLPRSTVPRRRLVTSERSGTKLMRRASYQTIHPALRVSSLAMSDHDRQTQGGGHSSYGEAVGVVLRSRTAARPRPFSFADGQLRLSGRYFRWTMATPMKRPGSEDLAP